MLRGLLEYRNKSVSNKIVLKGVTLKSVAPFYFYNIFNEGGPSESGNVFSGYQAALALSLGSN